LQDYALEDTVGGYDESGTWMGGSVYALEGQILYALVRALKPRHVVQIGGWVGCSATHIGMALKANGGGILTSVDLDPGQCSRLWNEVRPYVDLVTGDGVAWLQQQPVHSIDLLFEDAEHSVHLTQALVETALSRMVKGGFMINHDAGHIRLGAAVCRALDQAQWDYTIYKPYPAQCGLAIGQV